MSAAVILTVCACLGAAGAGFALAMAWFGYRHVFVRRQRAYRLMGTNQERNKRRYASKGLPCAVLDMICHESVRQKTSSLSGGKKPGKDSNKKDGRKKNDNKKNFTQMAIKAGLSGSATEEGCIAVRKKLAAGLMVSGALIGLCLSPECFALFSFTGCMAGFVLPRWALSAEITCRRAELEAHLPEMLEVVVLGLGSGLPFERAFALYYQHFETSFAYACAKAQRQWTTGLLTREEALRELSQQYESTLLVRIVDSVIRSLRFGTALTTSLEAFSTEARSAYKSSVEECVAKAPVKMMVPTSALILPAMLILVLGPILLEMMQGL